MIKVSFSSNVKRLSEVIDENTTVRQFLESNEVDYSRAITSIDGCPLQAGEMDKSCADFGITEKCLLTSVVKADNA